MAKEGTLNPDIPPKSARGRLAARLTLAALVLVVVLSVVETVRTLAALLAGSRAVTTSRQIVEQLEAVKAMLVDAETGVRGYVISGRPEFLEPHEATKHALDPALTRLKATFDSDRGGAADLSRLLAAIAAKMATVEQTRLLRSSQGMEAAIAAVASGRGRQLMDAVRAEVLTLQQQELDRLVTLDAGTASDLSRAKQLFILLGILAVVLVGVATILVERGIAHAERDLRSEAASHREIRATMGEHDEQARLVRDSIIDAIITIDEHGTIEGANDATEHLFGYRADDMLGRNVKLLMPAPYREEHDGYLAHYLATGEARIIGIGREVVARRADGSTFPVDLAVSEARVGERRLFTGVLRDLTDRKRAEAEVRELQRVVQERGRLADVGAVTAQIVHDLGNPLAGLSMQAQRLGRAARRGDAAADSIGQMTDQILGSVRRLDGMLQELRDFARQQRLDLSDVDLRRLLATTRDVWAPVAAAKGVTLELSCDIQQRIMADEHKLLRVLDNLVKNAIEAIPDGPGKVGLALAASSSPRHTVRISVSDSGSGIPENFDVFRLFETTKANGSGLGLSIARRIVEAHGGGLTFARIDPHGTVFHIDLPARPAAAGAPGSSPLG